MSDLLPPNSGEDVAAFELKEFPDADLNGRFWPKVDRSGDCWVWTGSRSEEGYGLVGVGKLKRRTKRAYAHRLVFELYFGPIPMRRKVGHRCRNTGCVNPAHLLLNKPSEYALGLVPANRPDPAVAADEVRRLHSLGVTDEARLAVAFDVPEAEIHRIVGCHGRGNGRGVG